MSEPTQIRRDVDGLDVPVVEHIRLPPDPNFIQTLGLNHAFETAVADLVDNSLDAGAERVLVRFILHAGLPIRLYVVDDGRGIRPDQIDDAMTLGGRREYQPGEFGHFGVGLKGASLGQAESLVLISRAAGHQAVGRRLLRSKAAEGFECDVLEGWFADAELDRGWEGVATDTGTLVRWDRVKAFDAIHSTEVAAQFLEEQILRLRRHLGLIFHRLLASGRVGIAIDVQELESGDLGPPYEVEPIDPFRYTRTGAKDYPKRVSVQYLGQTLQMRCHIWPGRSQLPEFRLGPRPESFQGFYFYRNDRLLQAGGWSGVAHPHRYMQLARVEVDLSEVHDATLQMNAEKTRLDVGAGFAAAVDSAVGERGFSFSQFCGDAESAYRFSRRRSRARRSVVPPGKGFHPRFRGAVRRELDYVAASDALSVRWTSLPGDVFFDIDCEEGSVFLNQRYRKLLVDRGGLNDAPLLKALMYLLLEELFHGSHLGPRDKDNIRLWQALLTVAAKAEQG